MTKTADVERSAAVAVTARVQNNGQSCIAAKRFIVDVEVHDGWADRFVAGMAGLRVGDPMETSAGVGPLVTEAQRKEIAGQVDDAREKGATVACGGSMVERPGWYYEATVLLDVTTEMRVLQEEVFGPVATVEHYTDLDEAIRFANRTQYGLGSSMHSCSASAISSVRPPLYGGDRALHRLRHAGAAPSPAGEAIQDNVWHLGRGSASLGWIAVDWTAFTTVQFCLPTVYPVTFGTLNYSAVAIAVVLFGAGGWYLVSAKKWFHGPQTEGTPEELKRIELELGAAPSRSMGSLTRRRSERRDDRDRSPSDRADGDGCRPWLTSTSSALGGLGASNRRSRRSIE